MIRSFFILLFAIISIFQVSCDGVDGNDGPPGPKGDPGAAGSKGDKGDPGTANVIYSDWITPKAGTATEWKDGTIPDPSVELRFTYFDLASPSVTQDVLDKGSVLVYAKFKRFGSVLGPEGTVTPFPFTLTYYEKEFGLHSQYLWNFQASVGNVRITQQRIPYAPNMVYAGDSFRYVVIPGGQTAGRIASVDFNDYKAVCKYYNIPE